VLVDSRAVVERTWQRWAEHRGIPAGDIVRAAHGRRTIETVREFAPHLDPVAEAQWLESVEVRDVEGLIPIDGAMRVYNALSNDRRAVVTSGGRELATTRLGAMSYQLPRVLVVAEDVTRGKPAPDAYLLAASRLGIDPAEAVVIEDAPAGIAAGKAASAVVIAVATTFETSALGAADVLARSLVDVRVVRADHDVVLEVSSLVRPP
jgi:sugar-phosphatase